MSGFRNWYVRNQDAITWFIIGWLCYGCIDSLTRGNYGWAAFDAAIAYLNYKMHDFRMS
jgi:hypothetical protein